MSNICSSDDSFPLLSISFLFPLVSKGTTLQVLSFLVSHCKITAIELYSLRVINFHSFLLCFGMYWSDVVTYCNKFYRFITRVKDCIFYEQFNYTLLNYSMFYQVYLASEIPGAILGLIRFEGRRAIRAVKCFTTYVGIIYNSRVTADKFLRI